MNYASRHLSSNPKARASTLAWLMLRDRKLAQLNAEIEAARKPKARLARDVLNRFVNLMMWRGA